MKPASPFPASAPVQPDAARGVGAGRHPAPDAPHPAPWPVEMTEIGLQYVIPGCERVALARPEGGQQ